MRRFFQGLVVTIGSLLLVVVSLYAASHFSNEKGEMVSTCDAGSVLTQIEGKRLCVDRFEVSPSLKCPYERPMSLDETAFNLVSANCQAVSVEGRHPWQFVSQIQAQNACAQVGKRLPTTSEWQELALSVRGAADCVIDAADVQITGGRTDSCVTPHGVADLIGNVWEWVTPVVDEGKVGSVLLPSDGYVAASDYGLPTATATTSDPSYDADYVTSEPTKTRGILRGGFYRSRSDAGPYAFNATLLTEGGTNATGFRCVYELSTN